MFSTPIPVFNYPGKQYRMAFGMRQCHYQNRRLVMSNQEKLVGSWNVAVTTPHQGSFPALLTFTADGSVIGTESPNPFESSGHG